MKTLFGVLVLCSLAVNAFAATRNFVPRADSEGGIGTSAKTWDTAYVDDATITYGLSATTVAFSSNTTVGGAVTLSDNLKVSSATLLGGTVGITGALTGASASLSTTLSATGNSYLGAALFKTTNTAATGDWEFPTTVSVLGATDLIGAVEIGAENAQSTVTAAGVATFNTSVTAPALSGTTSIAGGAISGTTLAMSGAGAILGAVEMGAENTQSTVTAAGVATFNTSVTAPAITGSTSVSGAKVTASAGPVALYSRSMAEISAITSTALGEMYFCNDCTPKEIAVSTGIGAPNTGGFGNAAGAQLN